MTTILKKIVLLLADYLRNSSRRLYKLHGGVCWVCGTRCGMRSTVDKHGMWCDDCFRRFKWWRDNQ